MSDSVIRVIIVDDQVLMRDGLASLLDFQPEIEVVGKAENGKEAIAVVADLLPDVVLMDITMPKLNGIEATRKPRIFRSPGSTAITTDSRHRWRAYPNLARWVEPGGPNRQHKNCLKAPSHCGRRGLFFCAYRFEP